MRTERLDQKFLQRFIYDYLKQPARCQTRFSYDIHDQDWLASRANDVAERAFPHRQALCDVIEKRHARLPQSDTCLKNIHKLRQEETLVVVGGQQAGILTGPLYTVYKAMSLIILAKQYEQVLKRPVIPLFWVAGEDHDLDEIRFTYTKAHQGWTKNFLKDMSTGEAASEKALPQVAFKEFTEQLFASLPETAHTRDLQALLMQTARMSQTYSDFFCALMHALFADEGLLYIDSGDVTVRQLERPFFRTLIDRMPELQTAQQIGSKAFSTLGYPDPIVTEKENAHLFLTVDGSRRRLDYADGHFFIKGTDISYSQETLLQIASESPERLSNNVVTRPLMQEWLLPTLAFVAGPGELTYWATLKEAFTLCELKVPPIVPRLSATIVPRHVEKWLANHGERAVTYIAGEGKRRRDAWLAEQHPFSIESYVDEVQKEIMRAHQPLRKLAGQLSPTLQALSEKNASRLQQELKFLQKKMIQEIRAKHVVHVRHFDEASDWLYPESHPQERVLGAVIFLNLYGLDVFSRMIAATPSVLDRPFVYYI